MTDCGPLNRRVDEPFGDLRTSALRWRGLRLWVVHAQPNRDAGRRLYGLELTFTPRWPQYAIELPLGRIASMSATGQLQAFGVAAKVSRKIL
jgi:hypothetical protein